MASEAEKRIKNARILGTTVKGKNIVYEPVDGLNTIRIKFEGGGQVPKSLGGRWSDVSTAQRAVTRYLKSKPSTDNATEKAADKSLQFQAGINN